MTDLLSIYDMDKTITRKASWMPWLFFFARTRAPARLLLVPLLALPALGFGLGLLDRAGLKQAAHRLMMGRRVHRDVVAAAADAFAARFGAGRELPAALAALAADRAGGARTLLATASSRFYAAALARRWGFDDLVATDNIWDGDLLTPRIAGENCYEMGKLRMLIAHLPARPGRVRFHSDHLSDLPVLLWADEAVAANPSPALRQEAVGRGWRVCDWAAAGSPATPAAAPDTAKAPTGTPSPGR